MKKIMNVLIFCGFTCIVYTKLIAIIDRFDFVNITQVAMLKNQEAKVLCSSFSPDLIDISAENMMLFVLHFVLR